MDLNKHNEIKKMQRNSLLIIWFLFVIGVFVLAMIDFKRITAFSISNNYALRHILAFSGFIILTKITWPTWHIIKVILAAIAFGFFIEIAQELLTAGVRRFYWQDLINDGIGIGIGLISIATFQILKRRLKPNKEQSDK